MSKHATAIVEMNADPGSNVSEEAMERRLHLADRIRARMAKPATAAENKLWQELKAEVSRERLTFRP
jgi:hypothetical protein